jgi:hypothetical protein
LKEITKKYGYHNILKFENKKYENVPFDVVN